MNPEANPPRKNTRAEQSRINGARSRGPTTAAGLAQCRKARLKHGCYARTEANGIGPLIRNENPEEFALFRQGWLARLTPQTVAEQEFADSFIANEWQLLRAQAAETALLNQEIRATKAQFEGQNPLLTGGEREQARLGFAVASLYQRSGAAVALDRKISRLQAARLVALRSLLLLPGGRSQEVTQNKPHPGSVQSPAAPGGS
jgi:hypothetical protein